MFITIFATGVFFFCSLCPKRHRLLKGTPVAKILACLILSCLVLSCLILPGYLDRI